MRREIVVVDYGSGNLFSIRQALTKCGARVLITEDQSVIGKVNHLLIPGVGAFGQCMAKIRAKGLVDPFNEAIGRGAWVIGICVGMQMFFEQSEEFGLHEGLGIIPGKVVRIPAVDSHGNAHKVPYIGWSPMQPASNTEWTDTILENVIPGRSCYFVHSFMAQPKEDHHRLADTYYGQTIVCAAVRSENVFGAQFHPEKSGQTGLAILERFLQL